MRRADNRTEKTVAKLDFKAAARMHDRILAGVLKAHDESRKQEQAQIQPNAWRRIVKSKITRLAAAAVIAIALAVPLSYGTAVIVRRLAGSLGIDQFRAPFKLDEDIGIKLQVGTRAQQRIVSAGNIRFFKEGEQVLGTLRGVVGSWPKFKWCTKVELLDSQGKTINSTQHVRENGGVKNRGLVDWAGLAVHFSLGSWHDVSQAQAFIVTFEAVPQETETTTDAWLESARLDVLHGRVTGPNGEPIPNVRIQIRERRKPGQLSIAAPDVTADKEGYYSFDEITWPYRVGALVYEQDPCGAGHRHQYLRSNKVLEGTQEVDFNFGRFPKGTATLSGRVAEPNGATIQEFSVDVRLKVDWKDYSDKYLYQFGIRKPFTSSDGRFEMSGLPAGLYRVSTIPTKNEVLELNESIRTRHYLCALVDDQTTEIGPDNTLEKVWYGRVLFDDGAPAVLDLPGVRAYIMKWEEGFPKGRTIAKVDDDGYFAAYISDEIMEWLRSGRCWLTISTSWPVWSSEIEKDRFPAELLSLQRRNAGVVKISRSRIYYGRVLYENGKPAVPETPPWPGATVSVAILYMPATATDGGPCEDLAGVDNEGYFAVYLTDEQLEHLKAGEYQIGVCHPSYEDEMTSYGNGKFPVDMLATVRSSAEGYRLAYEKMGPEFRNLKQQHDSLERLKTLGSVLAAYCADHHGAFPASLDELKSYDVGDLLTWVGGNVEYLGARQVETDYASGETALAYDNALLQKTKGSGTNVLFLDGRVEFCRPKRLEALGIGGVEK
jgi:prepilin-type processing-associated H-X9-DG protein